MMLIVSYDIADDKIRSRFSKMLVKNGAIRLQFSVYEVVNTKRVVDNIMFKIERYSRHFSRDDSVIIFNVPEGNLTKYGNAIHIDKDIVFL